jgi:leader peptidase (prepilin peptidase)/N-methyltransferase
VTSADLALVLACGVFGLLIGSFLNACAYRLPRKIGIATGRSACTSCGVQIKAYDNVPLLSYAVLRGRCRSCGARIHWRYPLVEGLTAVIFAALAAFDGLTPVLGLHLLFAAALILVSDIDLQMRIIPDVVVLPVAAIGLAGMIVLYPESWWVWPVSGVGAAVFLLAASLVYERLRHQEGIGMGDVKLALCMGFYLGASVIPALFIGFIAGAVAGIAVLARGGSAKSAIPFGPFLALGALVCLFAGPAIIDWYLGLMTQP